MNILLTNDDSHRSAGLQLLCGELAKLGHNVYLIAPDGQRSGSSHSMNYNKEISLTPLGDYFGAKEAFGCSGTPADCVRIAILRFGVHFDLLISGPNNAANFGRALMCSGTVGAAEEGTLCGVRSIALSRLEHCDYYRGAVDYVTKNLQQLADSIRPNMFLNINVPNLPPEQILGVRVCPQSTAQPLFEDGCEPMNVNTLKIVGKRKPVVEEAADVYLAESGYITVTPLSIDRTDYSAIDALKAVER